MFIPLLEIYHLPQIYSYSVLIGYFPGTIYDDFIPVSTTFIFYRLIILLIFLFSYYRVSKSLKVRSLIFPILIYILFILYIKPIAGFDTNQTRINKASKITAETANIKLRFFYRAKKKEVIFKTMEELFFLNQIKKATGIKKIGKIKSFVYADTEQKAQLFGSRAADVSKPWQRTIFIERNSSSGTIKHELAHAVSAEFGVGLLRLSEDFNPALIEGFAVATENSFLNHPVDVVAAFIYKEGHGINLSQLFSGLSFFQSSPAFGYLFAGSFVRFLITKFGFTKFKKYYATNSFTDVYGVPFSMVQKDFFAYLSSLPVKKNTEIAKIILGSKSVLKRTCRHYVAEKLNTGKIKVAERNFFEAENIYSTLFDKFNSPEALFLLVNLELEENNKSLALETLTKAKPKIAGTPYELRFNLLLSQLLILNNERKKAVRQLTEIKETSPFYYYENISELLLTLAKLKDNSISEYLKMNGNSKFNFLKDKYIETKNEIYLINLIRFAKYNDLVNLLETSPKQFSPKVNFFLSKYFLRNIDFERAKYYSNKLNDNAFKSEIFNTNNLKEKVNWFYANKDIATKIVIK